MIHWWASLCVLYCICTSNASCNGRNYLLVILLIEIDIRKRAEYALKEEVYSEDQGIAHGCWGVVAAPCEYRWSNRRHNCINAVQRVEQQHSDCLIQPIFIMLLFVRGERASCAAKEMMPYLFCLYAFQVHARYGILYIISTHLLHSTLLERLWQQTCLEPNRRALERHLKSTTTKTMLWCFIRKNGQFVSATIQTEHSWNNCCVLLWTAYFTTVAAKNWKRMDTTQVLHMVLDRYNKMSIKSACRTAHDDGCCLVSKLSYGISHDRGIYWGTFTHLVHMWWHRCAH